MDIVHERCSWCRLWYGTEVFYPDGRTELLIKEKDHIIPVAKGGLHGPRAYCCHVCNERKSDRDFGSDDAGIEKIEEFCVLQWALSRALFKSPFEESYEIPEKTTPTPRKRLTYAEAVALNPLSPLLETKKDGVPESEVLFNPLPSPSFPREEEKGSRDSSEAVVAVRGVKYTGGFITPGFGVCFQYRSHRFKTEGVGYECSVCKRSEEEPFRVRALRRYIDHEETTSTTHSDSSGALPLD